MSDGHLGSVVRYLRQVAAEPHGETRSDGQLLRQFADSGDEAAFAMLVERHGPMVLAVCRRVLQDPHAAEDAFQATFLVLSRKARSIRKQESVGSWLHGVAYRIALKAYGRASVQRDRETALNDHPHAAQPESAWLELRPVLDEELSRLPEKYRAPLVLCYLEGKTNAAAARELGWTKGTVSGRLARARDLLRKRLQQRGLSLTPALLATLLCEQAAPAALAAPVLVATVKAACGVASAGLGLGGTGKAISLAEGAIQTMFLTKSTIAIGLILTLTAFSAGMAVMGYASVNQDAAQPAFLLPGQAATGEGASDKELLQGTWVVVAAKGGGQEREEMYGMKITFQGDKIKLTLPSGGDGTFRLFPDKLPKRIDLILADSDKGMGLGIYKLEEDKLFLCVDDYNNGRPATFASKAGSKHAALMLQRVGGKSFKAKVNEADLQKLRAENEKLQAQLNQLQAKIALLMQTLEKEKNAQSIQKALDWLKLNQDQINVEQQNAKEQQFLALMALAQADAKDAANRQTSMNNLKQIGLAFHNYADQTKKLPAANIYSKDGKPLLSWRVAILPFIDQEKLYKQFKLNEPWDSDHNKKLLDQMPKLYAPVGQQAKDKHSTFYQVFTGPKTPFDGSTGTQFTDITDGTSNTALVVEAGVAVPWTKPQDLPYQGGKPLPKLGGLFNGGFNLLLVDGSVRFVPAGFDEDTLRLLITIDDGMAVDFEKLSPPKKQ